MEGSSIHPCHPAGITIKEWLTHSALDSLRYLSLGPINPAPILPSAPGLLRAEILLSKAPQHLGLPSIQDSSFMEVKWLW